MLGFFALFLGNLAIDEELFNDADLEELDEELEALDVDR